MIETFTPEFEIGTVVASDVADAILTYAFRSDGVVKHNIEFEMELVVEGTDKILADGFSPGGVVKQFIKFEMTEDEMQHLPIALSSAANDFIKNNIKVIITPVKNI